MNVHRSSTDLDDLHDPSHHLIGVELPHRLRINHDPEGTLGTALKASRDACVQAEVRMVKPHVTELFVERRRKRRRASGESLVRENTNAEGTKETIARACR